MTTREPNVAAIRGGFANILAQLINTSVRLGVVVVLARLLTPNDFGLVAMVTSIVGILNMFKDFGLSTATIQKDVTTDEHLSALFWINILIGSTLAGITAACAVPLAIFYGKQELVWITITLASAFLINATCIQHVALMQRQMRFTALAAIDSVSLFLSAVIGIALARTGVAYWAIVLMTISQVAIYSVLVWLISGWAPFSPRRVTGILPYLRTGASVTLNGLIMYVANSLDKVLIGKYFGVEALGFYGRAQQLVSFPIDIISSSSSSVLLSSLSRLKADPALWKTHFLNGHALIIGIATPISALFWLYAEELVMLLLGPAWRESVPIFRYLSPTIFLLSLLNPMWPLVVSLNLISRSLKSALVLGPIIVFGYVVGLAWGPTGAALGITVSLSIWTVPHMAWIVHGTPINLRDVMLIAGRPIIATLVALAIAGSGIALDVRESYLHLTVGCLIFVSIYFFVLLFVLGQWRLFVSMIRMLTGRIGKPG